MLLLPPLLYDPRRPPSDRCTHAFICAPSATCATPVMPPFGLTLSFYGRVDNLLITCSTKTILLSMHPHPLPPSIYHSSLLLSATPFLMFLFSPISVATLVRHRLCALIFSSILVIPYIFQHCCHHPPGSRLQSLSHHFTSYLRSSSTCFSHGHIFYSALLFPRCFL